MIQPHDMYQRLGRNQESRREAYRGLFKAHLDPEMLDQIRSATNGNYALGSSRFQEEGGKGQSGEACRVTYQHDGRVIVEDLQSSALPSTLKGKNGIAYKQLSKAYKQINSAVGELGLATLEASTVALTGNDANDATYTSCTAQINNWTQTRNDLATQMKSMLDNAAFHGVPVNQRVADELIRKANQLIRNAHCS